MFCNTKALERRVAELEAKIVKMDNEKAAFIERIASIMQSVLDNDKRKFMYEVQQQDVELMEDGKKYRRIRKIIT